MRIGYPCEQISHSSQHEVGQAQPGRGTRESKLVWTGPDGEVVLDAVHHAAAKGQLVRAPHKCHVVIQAVTGADMLVAGEEPLFSGNPPPDIHSVDACDLGPQSG